ncbi:DUF502 domain-containing protein [SAR202 cluster bacterium AC-409-J13_OGT_754m]|nr:DUF502 domain-containing protein [SAR202 cluster bacterium AC-409-J13_OGT_754m]
MHKLFVRLGNHFKGRFLAGLLIILPLGTTYLVLKFLFDLIDEPLREIINTVFGTWIPGIGIFSFIVILYFSGLVARHVIGRNIINFGNRLVDFIPFVRSIYKVARNTIESLSVAKFGEDFTRVVLLEFPKVGVKSVGFMTSQYSDTMDNDMVTVYIPTSPVPTSGFLALVPKADVTFTDLTVDDAMKMVISGGVLTPSKILEFTIDKKWSSKN